jgi:hypothetical protein
VANIWQKALQGDYVLKKCYLGTTDPRKWVMRGF